MEPTTLLTDPECRGFERPDALGTQDQDLRAMGDEMVALIRQDFVTADTATPTRW